MTNRITLCIPNVGTARATEYELAKWGEAAVDDIVECYQDIIKAAIAILEG